MPIIDFSQEDLLKGKIVNPAWYKMEIGHLTESLAKNGESTNWVYEDSKILCDADSGDTTNAGVTIPIRFNSKAKGFLVGFFNALGGDVAPGKRFELKEAEGKQIEVFVENDTYEGRLVNRINHKYRACR